MRAVNCAALQLAVIAPIDAIAHGGAQSFRDGAVQLDGQIGNAAARIELVGRDDGGGRAGRYAGTAAAAVCAGRFIDGQRAIGVDLTKKEI
jgi:hypothetical protein